jgi:hypothetical protein
LSAVCVSVTLEVEKPEGSGESRKHGSLKLFLDLTMRWWCVVDIRRCFLANIGSDIKELKDLQRYRSCKSKFTGSLHRISAIRSKGIVGIDSEAEVRVSVVSLCVAAVVSSVSN